MANVFIILRRIRQATCGECWADPGCRCRVMEWRQDLGYFAVTPRLMVAVHPSRTLRAQQKGLLWLDLAPSRLAAISVAREHLGMSVAAGRMGA
jgi:hypothetical protein